MKTSFRIPLIGIRHIHILAFLGFCRFSAALDLPLGAINVVVLTDVHSWIAGHGSHEPVDNADYGDVLSFYERLQQQAPEKDFFLVNNGDFMDGTGLSTYPPTHLTPILERMPWDAFNIGNHELYFNTTVEHITQEGGFVDILSGKYLTSNVIMKERQQPIGSRYTYLYGKNSKSTLLTFGFLFDFDGNCPITIVESVEKTVQSKWFTSVLQRGSFDSILILAHMDVQHPLVFIILNAIRQIVGDNVPVVFITGHTHYRGFAQLDANAISFEAGRYLDTVGFVSFETQTSAATDTTIFHHVFLDANVDMLKTTLGVDSLTTPSGASLTSFIHETHQELGLLKVLGCAPETYYLEKSLNESQSLWALYLSEVIEKHFFQGEKSFAFVQGTGAFRYSLLQGNVTVDDMIAVSPFNDTIYMVAERISGTHLLEILGLVNQADASSNLPPYAVAGTVEPQYFYDLFTVSFELSLFQDAFYNVTGSRFDPVQQYRDGTPVTTTGLWMDFVSTSLVCDKKMLVKRMNPAWFAVCLAIAVTIARGGWWIRNRYAKKDYESIVDRIQVTNDHSYRAVV